MFRGVLEPWHLIIILVLVVLLFGAKRLPDASRAIGRSMKIFKAEVKELSNDDKTADGTTQRSATGTEGPVATGAPAPRPADAPPTVTPPPPVPTASTPDPEPAGQQRV